MRSGELIEWEVEQPAGTAPLLWRYLGTTGQHPQLTCVMEDELSGLESAAAGRQMPPIFDEMEKYSGRRSVRVALVDPAVSLDHTMSFDELRQQPLALRRTISVLTSVFGAIALLLAAVGIYGTMSQVVGQRTREIGVRMAFGARVEDIFRLVVGQGMRPVLAGLVLGIGAAAGISRLVANELFGVTPADPLTHAVAIAAVLIAALVALLLPARRATRVDPVTTLRST